MAAQADTNESIWKSESHVKSWISGMDEHERRRSQPLEMMARLLPFESDDDFIFLDLGAGIGAAARTILRSYPKSRAILADFSSQMIGHGAKVMAPFEGRYRYVEFDMNSSDWPVAIPLALDAVVTSLCVHHLPDERKRALFQEIFARLKAGGWYVNFDPVKASEMAVEEVWERVNDRYDPVAAERRKHPTAEERARRENHLRYVVELDQQLRFFREAGFEAVDVYWKRLDYVIYAGRRPSGS